MNLVDGNNDEFDCLAGSPYPNTRPPLNDQGTQILELGNQLEHILSCELHHWSGFSAPGTALPGSGPEVSKNFVAHC